MIKKYSELKNTEFGRQRPREVINFAPPIKGPSGAKVVAYEWKWMWDLVEDDIEGTIEKRVSDWENADINDETGRQIVHQFVVQTPDNQTKTVSAETAFVLLGLVTPEQKKELRSVGSSAKTLARLKVEQIKMQSTTEAYLKDLEVVKSLPKPETIKAIYEVEFKFTELKYGDVEAKRPGLIDRRIPDSATGIPEEFPATFFGADLLKSLQGYWVDKRMFEKGWNSGTIPSKYMVDRLNTRIKKQESKLEQVLKKGAQI